jgi:hypothetical protein
MRFTASMIIGLMLSGMSSGCGKSSQKTAEASPATVLGLAQDLEKDHKIKNAIAAYHQIMRYYPGTPEAASAAERIKQLQSAALRKPRTPRGKSR